MGVPSSARTLEFICNARLTRVMISLRILAALAFVLFVGLFGTLMATLHGGVHHSGVPLIAAIVCLCAPWPSFLCRAGRSPLVADFLTGAGLVAGAALPLMAWHVGAMNVSGAIGAVAGAGVAGAALVTYMHAIDRHRGLE